jgi:acyl carrier protein phosphodiesterase
LSIGNFMADGIRGNQYLSLETEIQKGVLLHRFIDSFTDAHHIYRQSKHRLHENYGHYSGVIMDIVYDHYLAKNWSKFHDLPLKKFAENFYDSLSKNYHFLTDKTKNMMPYMIDNDWLTSYATLNGLEMILFQMDYRTKHQANMQEAMVEIEKYYTEFESEFFLFFKELQFSSNNKLKEIEATFNL